MSAPMRVTKEWKDSFDAVIAYMQLSASDVEECKAEAREHPAWAIGYYPWAAAQIRARLSGSTDEQAHGAGEEIER